jgi:hypothetical protein
MKVLAVYLSVLLVVGKRAKRAMSLNLLCAGFSKAVA